MKKFLFQLSNDYLNKVFLRSPFAEITYSCIDTVVTVEEIIIPDAVLMHTKLTARLFADIQAAAENNAISEGLMYRNLSFHLIIHDQIAVS